MTNMETMVDKFMTEHSIDEDMKESIIDLLNGCFTDYVSHMAASWLDMPVGGNKANSGTNKGSKKDKLENPAEATSLDELRNCTSVILNEFCKDNKLKIGGNKKDIMERVWRHIQGKGSDDDKGRGAKSKKEKTKVEAHACFASTSKGDPCGLVANEEFDEKWFCHRHITDAESIIAKKGESSKTVKKNSKNPKNSKSKKKELVESDEENELVESE